MAAINFEDWVPTQTGDEVIKRVQQASAIESLGRGEPMSTTTKEVPRSGGFVMAVGAKSSSLSEDNSSADNVILSARKIRAGVRIAEEDLEDSLASIIDNKSQEWANSYAKFLDNAALGVDAAENGTTVPFTSVYKEATDNSRLIVGPGATPSDLYDDLNDTLKLFEEEDYFDNDLTVIVAHPIFKSVLRGVKDTNERPIFVPGAGLNPDTLFDYQITWTTGARVHATATQSPTGNPLLVVANRDFLIRGDRSDPEFRVDYDEDTDEQVLQGRARKAFAVGHTDAVAVFEYDG